MRSLRQDAGNAWLAAATLAEPVADAVDLTTEAKVAELAPEPCRATTSFIEALVKVGGVAVDTGLANTRGRFWVDFSVPELLHGAVVKVELPTEIPIRSSRLQEVSHPLP
jgi:hypothetical protein